MSHDSKLSLRKHFLDLLRMQKEEDRLSKSRVICEKFLASEEYQRSRTILFYASFNGEVDTYAMIKQALQSKKNVALPITMQDQNRIIPTLIHSLDELETGPYNIAQPQWQPDRVVSPKDLDMILVPGLAFDRHNHRLGRGAGYYDRFLQAIPSHVPAIGAAFDFQIVDRLSHQEEHDIPVTGVISN